MYKLTKKGEELLKSIPENLPVPIQWGGNKGDLRKMGSDELAKYWHKGSAFIEKVQVPEKKPAKIEKKN